MILVCLNVYVTLHFLRLGDLMNLLRIGLSKSLESAKQTAPVAEERRSFVIKAIGTLQLHKGVMNPYSHFNSGTMSEMMSNIGYVLLILTWFMGFTSIYILTPELNLISILIFSTFVFSTAVLCYSMFKTYNRLIGHTYILGLMEEEPSLDAGHDLLYGTLGLRLMNANELKKHINFRGIATGIAFLVGILIVCAGNAYQGAF